MSLAHGVHFPKDPNKFEFDDEVAQVFDDMARRSIPMYEEAHRVHASLVAADREAYLKSTSARNRPFRLMDIGASTGQSFRALYDHLGVPYSEPLPNTTLHVLEPSAGMANQIRQQFPHAEVVEQGAAGIALMHKQLFDVVYMNYVLQFIPVSERYPVLRAVHSSMAHRGLFILAQKELIPTGFHTAFNAQYIQMRRNNGYTQEEIDAKSAALASSMWPQSNKRTDQDLTLVGFFDIQETTRWLNFSSLVCRAG